MIGASSLRFLSLATALLIPLLGFAAICNENLFPSNPDNVYVSNGDGTVRDTRNGLIWKACAEGQSWSVSNCAGTAITTDWANSFVEANNSSFAGFSDWRIPNLKELRSLVEECRSSPSINYSFFPGTPTSHFWSSTPVVFDPRFAFTVSFDYGNGYNARTFAYNHIRLVRGGQTSAPVSTPRLEFDTIAQQTAGVPFPVTVRARSATGGIDTRFNGWVRLSDGGFGAVTPTRLHMTNGVATGNVSVLRSGQQRLAGTIDPEASAAGMLGAMPQTGALLDALSRLAGSSNAFTSIGTLARPYTLSGTTTPGTSIQLSSGSTVHPANPVIADANGNYTIDDVTFGKWTLVATLAGHVSSCTPDCQINVDRDLTHYIRMVKPGRRAVLVIPGIMGSTLSSDGRSHFWARDSQKFSGWWGRALADLGGAPKLPWKTCDSASCELRRYLQIYDPATDAEHMGTDDLMAELDRHFDVYAVPWDWRLTFDKAAEYFLKPKIDEIKRDTGVSKVDIVAHSMGGLVARSYIQSDAYANRRDVDRLIMLGTPNLGSTNAYWLMGGGDPLALDRIVSTPATTFANVAFYTGAANELYRTHYWSEMLKDPGKPVTLDSEYADSASAIRIRDLFRLEAPGGGNLLPAYAFLKPWTSQMPAVADAASFAGAPLDPYAGMNPQLDLLNNASMINARFAPIGSAADVADEKVGVRLYASNSEATLRYVGYRKKGLTIYAEGEPIYWEERAAGDGTVLTESVRGLFPPGMVVEGNFGGHAKLFGNRRCDVVVDLGGPGCALGLTARLEAPPTPWLGLSTVGGYALLLTNGSAQRIGSIADSSAVYQEPTGSDAFLSPYQNRVSLANPSDGTYRLRVSNEPALANTLARVVVSWIDSAGKAQESSVRLLAKAATRDLDLIYDGAAIPAFRVVEPVSPPIGLRAVQQTGMTLLQWTAPADASAVVGYVIYHRPVDSLLYALLGTTTQTSFASSVPWAPNSDSSDEFLVLSQTANGTESLIAGGNSTRNYSYARATFSVDGADRGGRLTLNLGDTASFTDLSTATASLTSWEWDFNSDGVIDSTVQNPSVTFPSYGAYTVTLTVRSAEGLSDTRSIAAMVSVPRPACGTAHGMVLTSAPITNLCAAGAPGIVTGSGPWTWTCGVGDPASCTAALSIVDHYYQNILNRGPDTEGKSFWQSEVTRMGGLGANPKETYIAMARYFFTSPEFIGRNLDDEGFVRNLYLTFFNRTADQGGLDYWKGQIALGLPRDMVMYAFMFSNEFNTFMNQNAGGGEQRAEIGAVIDYYRGAFGRLPDDGGMKYWVNRFRTAQCSSNATGDVYAAAIDIAGGFFGGADYWATPPTNIKYVSDLYNAFMRRSADLHGFNYWVSALGNNNPNHTVMRKSFIDTPEFAARVQAITGQRCTALMQ